MNKKNYSFWLMIIVMVITIIISHYRINKLEWRIKKLEQLKNPVETNFLYNTTEHADHVKLIKINLIDYSTTSNISVSYHRWDNILYW